MEKNEIYNVTIDSISSSGFGVCRIDGLVVFVADAVTGDKAEIKIIKKKKSYAVARVEKIIEKSPIRIDSDCAVFKRCGGCAYRNISYEAETTIKKTLVKDAFERIGGIKITLDEYVAAQSRLRYRNKGQFPVSADSGRLNIGFYASRTHKVVDCRDCLLQPEIFGKIIDKIADFVEKENVSVYDESSGKGLLRHIYLRIAEATDEIALCLVVNGRSFPKIDSLVSCMTECFPQIKSISLNVNEDNTNVILGKETVTVWGSEYITDTLCSRKFRISPQSFYQVNRVQAQKLYQKAVEYAELTGEENVVDLYCGAGTIGLCLADKSKKLIGVELVPQAIENAKENAVLNGIDNAEFICGDAEEAARILFDRGEKADVIIVDPPRKGLTEPLIETITKMNPDRVVYVSCDTATQARDCKVFFSLGYDVKKISAVDMFPGTVHVESVVALTKNQ